MPPSRCNGRQPTATTGTASGLGAKLLRYLFAARAAAHGPGPTPWPPPTAAGLWGAPVAAGHEARRRTLTRSRHRAEAFQIEAQAGPGSGIPPAKMSQRVSLSDGEGLLPSLCSDEPRAERTDQRVYA